MQDAPSFAELDLIEGHYARAVGIDRAVLFQAR
jgi:hypothetical protein